MMRTWLRTGIALCLLAAQVVAEESVESAGRFWPQWRGPRGTGVAPHANPPLDWSEEKNVRWKVRLPGHGHSTPVIWGDLVLVTAAVPYGEALEPRYSKAPGAHDNLPVTHHHRFVVLAIRRRDGRVAWQRVVHEELPHEAGHYSASLASNSPATNGKWVIASFGSRGIYCLDLEGQLRWKKDLGEMLSKHGHGEGSTPVWYHETVAVNWDHEGKSMLIAFDADTGAIRWKMPREEVTSWASPIVVDHQGEPQLIVSGTKRVRAYHLNTGQVIWECGGLSANVVASPVAGDGMVYVGSSYDTKAMLAIRLDGAAGDITGSSQVAWTRTRNTPYVPSPLLYGEQLYFLRHYQGVLSRVAARTGEEPLGPFRLGPLRNIYASPVGAAGRVYITDREGATAVIHHGDPPRVLALNRLDDSFSASAAVVEQELFLRGEKYLYCLAEE